MSHNQAVGQTHDANHIEGLKPGAKLLRGQYEIIRFLSNGGFGITYLARDSLDRDVVIKECYPGALCCRNGDAVEAIDPAHKDDLRAIIDLFIQEARNHARLVHPNIVDVHQVFEDNQTAYIAMDLIRGCDLLDYVQDPLKKTSPDFIVQVTEKMLSAVSFIHDSGMLHRDISPDNILIDEHGEPILIDFGAAREQAANQNAALLTLRVIKDGYSPHEFYVRGSQQGPSSDLYLLAATLYHTISGERPVDGQTRLNAFNTGQPDPYVPLAGRFQGYPKGFLEAIDKAMEVHAADRLQTALDWLRMFRGPGVVFETFGYRPVSVIVAVDREDEEELSEAEKERIRAETENAEAVVNALLAGNPDIALNAEEEAAQAKTGFTGKEEPLAAVDTVVQSGGRSKGTVLAGVAAVIVAFAAGGIFALSGGDRGKPADSAGAPVEPAESIAVSGAEPPVGNPEEEAAAAEDVQTAATEATVEPETVAQEAGTPKTTGQPLAEQPAAAPAAKETAAVAPAQAGEETAPEAVSVAEPVEEPAARLEEAASAPAEPVNLKEDQVAFAHWDIDPPFTTSIRRLSTANVVAITGVDPQADMSVVGDWVSKGDVIYTLNGEPVRDGATFATQVLDNLNVDPDGHIRVVARYRPMGETKVVNGLLALPAVRVFGLANGVTLAATSDGNGTWSTKVTQIGAADTSDLNTGDVLLNEAITGQQIDTSESLDKILAALVAEGQSEARLTVLRNGAEVEATMRLAEE
ncbi:serine/threonine protein kinase [Ruegeria marisrubri]|uniref:Serine/threonine protein kinase n=1 Tax=Ruegeria marisrubri TaxID=1685379 RepID=A0A0X3TBM3_9RHOB|nr:protein kinase [Ruegeria marisrubri]KUJ73174.1 serine/threonine protein kinase [Ruegeria marisrubri]